MTWHAKPKTVLHAILGRHKLWCHHSGLVRVGRFIDDASSPIYAQILRIVEGRELWDNLSTHRKVEPAKAACEKHLESLSRRAPVTGPRRRLSVARSA